MNKFLGGLLAISLLVVGSIAMAEPVWSDCEEIPIAVAIAPAVDLCIDACPIVLDVEAFQNSADAYKDVTVKANCSVLVMGKLTKDSDTPGTLSWKFDKHIPFFTQKWFEYYPGKDGATNTIKVSVKDIDLDDCSSLYCGSKLKLTAMFAGFTCPGDPSLVIPEFDMTQFDNEAE